MKYMLLIVYSFVSIFVFADTAATIKSVTAQQRYPWNGKVDIVVKFESPYGDLQNFDIAATNCETGAAVPIKSVVRNGADVGSDNTWTRRYIWDSTNDVGAVKIDDLALTVEVSDGVQLWENGPYWAECNVGATKPEEYGYYFWWGDTVGYKLNASNSGWVSVKDGASYSFSSCPTDRKSNSQLESAGYTDSAGNLVASYDAATAYLGAAWRMPTAAEFSALINNCDTVWTTRAGVCGCLLTGRGVYALKSIFLPAAGYGYRSYLVNAGSRGCYLSSSPRSDTSNGAEYLSFGPNHVHRDVNNRYYGFSVRSVRGFAK